MTGGRRGLCGQTAGAPAAPTVRGAWCGRGMGYGRGPGWGRGRGRGRGFGGQPRGSQPAYPVQNTMPPTDEIQILKAEAEALRRELQAMEKRLEAVKSDESSQS